MKKRKAAKKASRKSLGSRGYLATRVMVGLLGLILSVVLHELFHILVHWGDVKHVHFLSSGGAIVEVNVWAPPGYDLEGEEIAAYGITLLVILITTMIIFKIGDSEDKRSSAQILFPKDKEMQKISPSKLLELTDRMGRAAWLNPQSEPPDPESAVAPASCISLKNVLTVSNNSYIV